MAGLALMACNPPSTEPSTPAPGETAAASPPAATPPADTPPSLPTDADDKCNKAAHSGLIGKLISDPAVPAASPGVRHVGPNTQVTMDYRPDRLNIYFDDKNIITGMKCT